MNNPSHYDEYPELTRQEAARERIARVHKHVTREQVKGWASSAQLSHLLFDEHNYSVLALFAVVARQAQRSISDEQFKVLYAALYDADIDNGGATAKRLNDGGLCAFTVCPVCRCDDFTHVEGCTWEEG